MAALDFVRNILTNLLGSKQYNLYSDTYDPNKPKTGPGFTEPMQQPVPAKQKIIKSAQAADQAAEDLFAGYNKSRGLPKDEIANTIVSTARKYKIDPSLLAAVLFNESGFNPKAVNENIPGNIDRGIAQINTVAFPNVTDEQAYDPNFGIDFAGKLLRQNIDYFGGDYNRGVAAYNVGRGGAGIKGPAAYGGGPRGQQYIDRVSLNLTPDFAKQLGLKYSEGLFGQ